tara:strand:- start:10 stop:297 length:288 start_codon:yes stop_codon:yes gene_type:complete
MTQHLTKASQVLHKKSFQKLGETLLAVIKVTTGINNKRSTRELLSPQPQNRLRQLILKIVKKSIMKLLRGDFDKKTVLRLPKERELKGVQEIRNF